jgi:hypothetical protein
MKARHRDLDAGITVVGCTMRQVVLMAGHISRLARRWQSLGQAIAQVARADAADEADFPIKTSEDTGDVCGRRVQHLRQVRDRARPLAEES